MINNFPIPLNPTKGGTGLTSVTTGSLLYGSSTNVWSQLSIGSTGQVLQVSSGVPSWSSDIAGVGTGRTIYGGIASGTLTLLSSGDVSNYGSLSLSPGGATITGNLYSVLVATTGELKYVRSGLTKLHVEGEIKTGVTGMMVSSDATLTPTRMLEVRSTSAQQRWSYDGTYYWEQQITATCDLKITGVRYPGDLNSILIGAGGTVTNNKGGIGIGQLVNVTGQYGVAVGYAASNTGGGAAVGRNASVSSSGANAYGNSAVASGNAATALGGSASAAYISSIAVGYGSTATAAYQFVAGHGTYRIDAVYFGKGVTHAAPTAWTLNGTGGSGTNIAGGPLNIGGGKGTGTGTPGVINFQVSTTLGSGTTLQTLATRMSIAESLIYFGTGTSNVFDITNNRWGFGTSAPNNQLHISGPSNPFLLELTGSSGSPTATAWRNIDTAAIGNGVLLSLQAYNSANSGTGFATIVGQSVGSITAGAEYGKLQLRVRNNGAVGTTAICYEIDEYADTHTWKLNNSVLGNWSITGMMFGASTAAARALEVRSTSAAQIRGSYDASNYFELASSSGGDLTISASGGDIHLGASTTFSVDTANVRVGIGAAPTSNQLLTLTYAPTTSAQHRALHINSSPAYSTGGTISTVQRAFESIHTLTGTDTVTGSLQAIYGSCTANQSGGSASSAYGINGTATQAGSVDIATVAGSVGFYALTGTGNITGNAIGLYAPAPIITGSGTIANSVGLLIGNYGDAVVTTAYGIKVSAVTGAATNWGIYILGASTNNMIQGPTSFGQTAAPTARVDINEPTLGNKVFSRKSVATSDDPIDWERHGRVTTTDATTTVLTGCTETLTADNVYHIRGRVRARRTGGVSGTANDGGTAEIVGSFVHRGGIAVQIGTTTTVHSQFDQAWAVTFTVSGNDVRVSVTGAASNNITWHGLLEVSQVST